MTDNSGVYLETSDVTGETYVITENEDKPFSIHRLLAVAEYGIEAVEKNEVYHLNTISWDNRPSNINIVEDASLNEFVRRGYWKMVNGEPQLHQYEGTINELAKEQNLRNK